MKTYQKPEMIVNVLDEKDVIATSDNLVLFEGTGANASKGEDKIYW